MYPNWGAQENLAFSASGRLYTIKINLYNEVSIGVARFRADVTAKAAFLGDHALTVEGEWAKEGSTWLLQQIQETNIKSGKERRWQRHHGDQAQLFDPASILFFLRTHDGQKWLESGEELRALMPTGKSYAIVGGSGQNGIYPLEPGKDGTHSKMKKFKPFVRVGEAGIIGLGFNVPLVGNIELRAE